MACREAPELILLDIGLPGMDGLDALQHFNDGGNPSQGAPHPGWTARPHVPVIFLSARRRELDQVLGLELGADDYITKPFDLDVLARVKAVLRRAGRAAGTNGHGSGSAIPPIVLGDLAIDPVAHSVSRGGQSIQLPPREFDVLYALALEAGRVISVHDLVARVWGAEYEGEPTGRIRSYPLAAAKTRRGPRRPRRILTVRGVGYKLEPNPLPA